MTPFHTNPLFTEEILENVIKRKEGNCPGKSTSDGTNGEKVHKKIEKLLNLGKRKGRSNTSSDMALEQTRSTIGNGNKDGRG